MVSGADWFSFFKTEDTICLALLMSLLRTFSTGCYLFSVAQTRIEEVQQKWTLMIGILESVANEEIVVTYIRQLWSSKDGLTREKELYDRIKGSVTSKQHAVDFADELYNNSKLFAAILNSTSDVLDQYGSTVKEDIDILNLLGVQQMRPLMLSILDMFQIGEAQKSFKFLVSLAVRLLIVGRAVGSGALENNYAQRAVEIRKSEITTAKELAAAMRSFTPPDKEFESSFSNATVSRSNLARYYLRTLEIQLMNVSQPTHVPNANEQMVNLEHILPQHPSSAWGYIDPEIAKAYYNRIGNLTLLQKKANTELGNSDFQEKIKLYKISKFIITSSIASSPQWGIEDIEERQRWLAQYAVNAWPIKV